MSNRSPVNSLGSVRQQTGGYELGLALSTGRKVIFNSSLGQLPGKKFNQKIMLNKIEVSMKNKIGNYIHETKTTPVTIRGQHFEKMSAEPYENLDLRMEPIVEVAEIEYALFMKLIACNIFKYTNDCMIDKKANLVSLDVQQSECFVSGQALGKYLLVIKLIIKKVNQVFNISEVEVSHILTQPDKNATQNPETSALKQQMTKNWKIIDNQLQRIGIYIEPDTLQEYINGNVK